MAVKFADGTKVINQLTLEYGDYPVIQIHSIYSQGSFKVEEGDRKGRVKGRFEDANATGFEDQGSS